MAVLKPFPLAVPADALGYPAAAWTASPAVPRLPCAAHWLLAIPARLRECEQPLAPRRHRLASGAEDVLHRPEASAGLPCQWPPSHFPAFFYGASCARASSCACFCV